MSGAEEDPAHAHPGPTPERSARLPMGVRIINLFLILSIAQWIVGQGGAVVAYDLVANMGLHPTRDDSDPITVAVTRGIAFADVAIQLPFFVLGLVGLWRRMALGLAAAWIALGINLYWPTVAWAKKYFYIMAGFDTEPTGPLLNGALAFIFLFSAWAIWYLYRNRNLFE